MKKIVFFLSLLSVWAEAYGQLIINELSQGTNGAEEYVELLVLGNGMPGCNNECMDLRGWIIDDNNGWHGTGSGMGIAQGVMRFANHPQWECVKIGTLIVVYNENDRNPAIPPDDEGDADSNCVYIIPGDSPLLERNPSFPVVNGPPTYEGLTYPALGQWSSTGMSNTSDSYHTVSPSDLTTVHHALSWGNNTENNIIYFSGSAAGSVMSMTHAVDNNPYLQDNWEKADASTNQTPGMGNNATNIAWISTLNNNCFPHEGPSPTITGPPFCPDDIFLNISTEQGYASYQWSNGQSSSYTLQCSEPGVYTVTVTDASGCTGTDDFELVEVNAGVITDNAPVCVGDTVTLSLTTQGSLGNVTWWNSQDYYEVFGNGPTIQIVANGPVHYLIGYELEGCNIEENGSFYPVAPEISLGADIQVCEGEEVTLLAAATPAGGDITWQDSAGNDLGIGESLTINPSTPGAYTATYVIGNCVDTDQIMVGVNASPILDVDAPFNICEGESASLNATGTPSGGILTWQDDQGNVLGNNGTIEVTPENITDYIVAYELNGCEAVGNTTVNVISYATLGITPLPDSSITLGEQVVLDVTGSIPAGAVFTWSADVGEAPDGSGTVAVSPTETTTYTVTISSPEGCVGTASITILVLLTDWQVPNVFTPNGDQVNDDFYPIFHPDASELMEFKVFDRWGEMVHAEAALPWDGVYDGRPMPADIYIYHCKIRHADGTEESKAGDVALMR
jgi:gliding motility-associated-like protein